MSILLMSARIGTASPLRVEAIDQACSPSHRFRSGTSASPVPKRREI